MSLQAVDDNTGLLQRVNAVDGNLRIANLVWDTGTLSWVKQVQAAGGGVASSVTVINPSIPVTQSGSWNLQTPLYALLYDKVSDSLSYLGHASVGASQNGPVWRIQQLVFTVGGSVSITFADGDTNFDNTWANRASLLYS